MASACAPEAARDGRWVMEPHWPFLPYSANAEEVFQMSYFFNWVRREWLYVVLNVAPLVVLGLVMLYG